MGGQDVFWAWLSANWAGLLGAGVGVAGIILYLKGRRFRQVSYGMSTSPVIQPDKAKYPGLDVRYEAELIPRLTVTRLVVLNSGRETIDSEDISQLDPLTIQFPADTSLLGCGVTDMTRDPIGATARVSPERDPKVALEFAFLDPGDAFCVEVLHTAPPAPRPELKGTIKGVKHLRNIGTYVDIIDRGRAKEVKGLVGCLAWLYYRFLLPVVVLLSVLICVAAWLTTAWHMNLHLLSRESMLVLGQIALKLFVPILLLVALVPVLLVGLLLGVKRLLPKVSIEKKDPDSASGASR